MARGRRFGLAAAGAGVLAGARFANRRSDAVSDEKYAEALASFAGMADRVLARPERFLDADDTPSRGLLGRALHSVGDKAAGDLHPGAAAWATAPLQDRVDWWTRRIAATAGTAAALPRVGGVLMGVIMDRVPLQDALGAAASGLAVCAAAREAGVDDPADWVPLLGRVIFESDLSSAAVAVPDAAASEQALDGTDDGTDETDDGAGDPDGVEDDGEEAGRLRELGAGGRRAVRSVWRLARTFLEIQEALGHRPRGGIVSRTLANLPVVGLAGGWLDERGGLRQAAKETLRLVEGGRARR